MEGASGCHEPLLFTEWWSRRPWRHPHAEQRYGSQELKLTKAARRRCRNSAEEGVATEVSEARSEWAPWEDNTHARGATHREMCNPKRQGSVCPAQIRRSVRECREALGPLVSRTEPKTPWGEHAVKVAEQTGNARGTGVRSIIQVAEVGQTHRASCPPGGRKACWRARALARRKLEAPPDAGHEPREGETVRGKAFTIKSTCWFGL